MKVMNEMNSREHARRRDAGMTTLMLVTTFAFVTLAGVSIVNLSFLKSARFGRTTAANFDAEFYNRKAITFFKDRWDDQEIDVDLKLSLVNPIVREGDGNRGTRVPPPIADRHWRIDNSSRMILRSCPPGFDVNPAPGVALFGMNATTAQCVELNNFATTTVELVRLSPTVSNLRVTATTTLPNATNNITTTAYITVPPSQKDTDTVCEMFIDGVRRNTRENIVDNSTVNFELRFTPVLTSNIQVFVDNTEQTINVPQAISASPFTFSRQFTRQTPNQPHELRFLLTGLGVPCEHSATITIEPPLATPPLPLPVCKWADPTYFETLNLDVCEINVRRDPWTYRRGTIPNITVGSGQGVAQGWFTPDFAPHSVNFQSCIDAAPNCRMRNFGILSATNLTTVTDAVCAQAPNGLYAVGGSYPRQKYIVGIFDMSNSKCSSRIAVTRSKVDGCLPHDSLVRMASGTTKKISEINQDELVWNPVLKKGVRVLHSTVGEELNPLIVFTVGKHRISVTEKHPMMTDVGHIAAEKLKLGDKLLLANGRYGVIDSISADASRKGEHVWNLVLDNGPDGLPQPNFIADGFVVGDWKMQQALEWNLLKH